MIQLHNTIIDVNPKKSFVMMKNELEEKENKTNEDIQALAYFYDYEGNYKKANTIRKTLTGSINEAKVTLDGYVKDEK